MSTELPFQKRLRILVPHLDEKQKRWLAALEAQSLGYGGISKIARLTGLSRAALHPESLLLWTCKSTRELARSLTESGLPITDKTV